MLKSLILLVAVTACLAIPVAEQPTVPAGLAPPRQPLPQPINPDQKPEGDLNTDSSFWWGYSPYTYSYYTRPRYYSYYTPYYHNNHYRSYYYW